MEYRTTIAAALAVVLAQGAPAQEDTSPLISGERSIQVDLPPAAFAEEGGLLSIDIDGYDVSPFSRLDGSTLEIELETPLGAGEHVLTVLLFLPDGRAEVVLDRIFDVPRVDGGVWSLNTTLQTSYRAGEHPQIDFDGVGRSTGNGSIDVRGERVAGNWELGSALKAIHDGNGNDNVVPGTRSWLLPSYELSATHVGQSTETSIAAGNIRPARNNLLFSRFERRGAALRTASASGRFDVELFSVASAPRNGFDGDYLAPGDSSDRSSGLSASMNLLDDRLELSGGFIDGNTAFGGAGFSPHQDDVIYGGKSWNVVVDSRPLQGSVWLHLEHAESEFDADGIGIGQPARRDDAREARLRLSSVGRFGRGPFAYWSAELLHKRVGIDFYSVGNLSLPGSLETRRVQLQAGLDSVAFDIEVSRQRTNPENDPWLPTQTLRQAAIDITYMPARLDPTRGLWQKLGAPSLRTWIHRADSSQPDADASIAGFDVDNRTDEVGVAVTFARQTLTWGLEAGIVDYTDQSVAVFYGEYLLYEPLSDSRNLQTTVQVGWAPMERVSLDAFLQRNELEEGDFGNDYTTTNYGVGGTFFLVPRKLSLNISFNEGRDRRRFGNPQFLPENFRSRFTGLQLDWLIRDGTAGQPALGMYVKGNHARHEDAVFLLDDEISSIFIGVNVNWARDR